MNKCSYNRVWQLCCTIALATVPSIQASHAVEWSMQPSLKMSSVYNNNIWVSPVAKNQILDIRLAPDLTLNRESETSLLSLQTGWSQKKYISRDSETGGLLSAELNALKEFKRHSLTLETAYLERSTISSEATGSSRNLVETVKTEKKFKPSWQLIALPNFIMDLSFNYSTINFEKSAQQWFDYQLSSPTITGIYQSNALTQWSATLGISRYALEDIDYVVDSVFLQGGIDYELNANSQLGLMLGVQRVDSESSTNVPGVGNVSKSSTTEKLTINASYSIAFEKGDVALNANRNISPTSYGEMQFTDSAELNSKYLLSQNWSTRLVIYGIDRENVGSSTNVSSQKTVATRIILSWQIKERWGASLSYRWLNRKYYNQDEWVDSHRVMLSTAYTWDKTIIRP